MTNFHLGLNPNGPPPTRGPLAGYGVLLTRPLWQSALMSERIAALGGQPVIFPGVVITQTVEGERLAQAQHQFATYSKVFFVSANAVYAALAGMLTWPTTVPSYGVGLSTLEALKKHGVVDVRIPETTYDSEGLLQRADLQSLRGERVLVVRGEGGREHLAQALEARGAAVESLACYRRDKPVDVPTGAFDLIDSGRIHATTWTSAEGLTNVFERMSPATQSACKTLPAFVNHPRVGEAARALGINEVVVTDGGEAGLLAGLIRYYANSKP